MRPPSASIVPPSPAIASSASRRVLHPRTKIVPHPRLEGLRRLRRGPAFGSKKRSVFRQRNRIFSRARVGAQRFLLHRIQPRRIAFGLVSFHVLMLMLVFMIIGVFLRLLVGQFARRLEVRMRDHSFFFRRRFLFFQFAFVALRFRRRIGRGEYAFLRIARCQIVLRVRDVFRQRRHFFLAQIVGSVYLVCVPSRLARLGPFARRFVPLHHGIQRRRAKQMRFAAFPFSIRLRAFTRGFVRRSNFLAKRAFRQCAKPPKYPPNPLPAPAASTATTTQTAPPPAPAHYPTAAPAANADAPSISIAIRPAAAQSPKRIRRPRNYLRNVHRKTARLKNTRPTKTRRVPPATATIPAIPLFQTFRARDLRDAPAEPRLAACPAFRTIQTMPAAPPRRRSALPARPTPGSAARRFRATATLPTPRRCSSPARRQIPHRTTPAPPRPDAPGISPATRPAAPSKCGLPVRPVLHPNCPQDIPTMKRMTTRTSKREVPAQIAGRRHHCVRRVHPGDCARHVRQTGCVRRDLHRRPTTVPDIRRRCRHCAAPTGVDD